MQSDHFPALVKFKLICVVHTIMNRLFKWSFPIDLYIFDKGGRIIGPAHHFNACKNI